MKKIIFLCLVIMSSFLITSCDKETKKVDDIFELPPEMKDCKIYKMKSSNLTVVIYAIRCPLSTTTTVTSGKKPARVAVTETSENIYEKEENTLPKEKAIINGKTFVEE